MARKVEAKEDFIPSNLPHTRKEQFFDLLKNNYKELIKCGFLLLLFSLPFFVLTIIRVMLIHGAGDDGNKIIAIEILFYGTNIITSMVFSLGLAGILKIFKRLIWNEPIFYKHDLLEGIKENAWRFLLFSFLLSLLYGLSEIVIIFTIGGPYLCYISKVLYLVFFCPFMLGAIFFSHTYKSSLGTAFKAGIIFMFKCYPSTILSCLSIEVFLLLSLIPFAFMRLGILALSIVFLMPICILGVSINQFRIFDKFVNPLNYPQYVGKGLYKE